MSTNANSSIQAIFYICVSVALLSVILIILSIVLHFIKTYRLQANSTQVKTPYSNAPYPIYHDPSCASNLKMSTFIEVPLTPPPEYKKTPINLI